MTSRAPFGLALLGIAIGALALRLVGTEWGRPYAYHFDEPFILKPALRIVDTHDLNPHFFRYPSFMIYTEAAIVAANHVLGGMPLEVPEGAAYGPSDLGTWTWPALAGGRHAVAVLGTIGVVVAGILGRAIGGAGAGVLAALLLAVFPLHVEHSHYLTTDVPAATFLLLALASLTDAAGMRAAAAAGVALGLATATKYTAAAALPALLLLCLRGRRDSSHTHARRLAVLLAGFAGGFLVACPYALLDSGTFLAELRIVREHYGTGHLGAEGSANWPWYLGRLREEGLGNVGMVLFAAGAAGVVYDLIAQARGRRDSSTQARPAGERRADVTAAAVLLALALAWFAYLGAVTVRFERNLMPVVVLSCPVGAYGMARIVAAIGARRRWLGIVGGAVVVAALSMPALMSVRISHRLSGDDTRGQALRWIERNAPQGSHIVREEYTPQPDPHRYQVEYLWSLAFEDPREYRRTRVDYAIASQAVYARFLNDPLARYPDMVTRYRKLFAFPVAASFAPDPATTGPLVTIYEVSHAAKRHRR